jgi:putative flippase GtrA
MLRYFKELFKLRFIRFSIVGGIFALIDLSLLTFFVAYQKLSWVYVAPALFIVLTLIHYFVVIRFVFVSNPNKRKKEIALSLLIGFLGLASNQLILYIAITKMFIEIFLAKIFSIAINFFLNYFFRKHIVFK